MYECVAVMFFCAAKKAKVLMKGESDRMNEYHDMYDRMAKRCLMLSNRAIIQFINGIYEVNHPLDSEVTYNWTEHEDDDLRKTLADTIITIGGSQQLPSGVSNVGGWKYYVSNSGIWI